MMSDTSSKTYQIKDRVLTVDDLTPEQEYIMRRFSQTVRETLTAVEVLISGEDTRYRAVRKQINNALYDTRNDLLLYFTDEPEGDFDEQP